MHDLLSSYCALTQTPCFSLFDAVFAQGVATHRIGREAEVCFKDAARVNLGFRHYPFMSLNLDNSNLILLVRDPRDILVSLYYSVAESHEIPENHQTFANNRAIARSLDINSYCERYAPQIAAQHARYREAFDQAPQLRTFRYEDVVFDKAKWLREMVEIAGIKVVKRHVRKVAKRFDITPSHEMPNQHIRQVFPGDHRRKLSQETILVLNEVCGEMLRTYGYV